MTANFFPSVNKERVSVVQHAAGNEFNRANTTSEYIDFVLDVADYIPLSNGNKSNTGTADLNWQSSSFVIIVLESRPASEWIPAFLYLDPINDELDFSDTV